VRDAARNRYQLLVHATEYACSCRAVAERVSGNAPITEPCAAEALEDGRAGRLAAHAGVPAAKLIPKRGSPLHKRHPVGLREPIQREEWTGGLRRVIRVDR
jgi:hypothetical protein